MYNDPYDNIDINIFSLSIIKINSALILLSIVLLSPLHRGQVLKAWATPRLVFLRGFMLNFGWGCLCFHLRSSGGVYCVGYGTHIWCMKKISLFCYIHHCSCFHFVCSQSSAMWSTSFFILRVLICGNAQVFQSPVSSVLGITVNKLSLDICSLSYVIFVRCRYVLPSENNV